MLIAALVLLVLSILIILNTLKINLFILIPCNFVCIVATLNKLFFYQTKIGVTKNSFVAVSNRR